MSKIENQVLHVLQVPRDEMNRAKKFETIRYMDRLHPENGWKTLTHEVKPKLIHVIIPDKTQPEGYRIEKKWE